MPEEDPLLDVALSLTDGDPVDWAARDSGISAEDRRLLQRLQQIEALARVQGLAADAPSLHTSIRDGRDPAAAMPLRWGPLEVLEKVGRGSYGDVYRARDARLGRDVALKLLRHREQPPDEETTLVREAHLLARIRHTNVVTVHGAERIDGRTGLWMEFIDGETLEDDLRRRGALPVLEVARIGIALCEALEAVHAAGLLHRDVKAQDIMRERTGRLVLMDFGAGFEARDGSLHDGIAGTPAYLAPELLAGGAPSTSTDVYALGVVLFRLTTGHFPVEGSSLSAIREAHGSGGVRSIAAGLHGW